MVYFNHDEGAVSTGVNIKIRTRKEVKIMKYEFSNHEYLCSHMENPRGRGHWAFLIKNAVVENISPEVFIDKVSKFKTDTIFWVPGVWTLSEAKKRAKVMLEANAVPEFTTIYVAP